MKKTVSEYDFTRAFQVAERTNFSYHGLQALYAYLEEYEESTGEEIELDVIALCCEYAEYDSLEDFQADYGKEYETFEDIQDETSMILIDAEVDVEDGSFIIQQF